MPEFIHYSKRVLESESAEARISDISCIYIMYIYYDDLESGQLLNSTDIAKGHYYQ